MGIKVIFCTYSKSRLEDLRHSAVGKEFADQHNQIRAMQIPQRIDFAVCAKLHELGSKFVVRLVVGELCKERVKDVW